MSQRDVELASIGENEVLIHHQPPPPQQQQKQLEINNSSVSLQANAERLKPNLPRRFLIAGPRENYIKIGVPLYEASIKCNWNNAKAILEKRPELVRYSITENGETALHVAASANGDPKDVAEFVRKLVGLMEKEDLALENENFNTALFLAAAAGNVETVKIMVEKNRGLLSVPGAEQVLPLYAAALYGNYDVVKYLYQESNDLSDDCWNPKNRGWLLEKCVEGDMFDTALMMVKKHPKLGRETGTILGMLASKPAAFGDTKSNIIKWVFSFMGSKVGVHETENQALSLLRIIWEDIIKKPRNEIDMILRGPLDSAKTTKSAPGRMVLAIQLQKLIYQHLDKMEDQTHKIIRDTNPTSSKFDHAFQLKNLISEYVVNLHTASQEIVKEDNMSVVVGKGDKAVELQKIISKHIVNMYEGSQDVIKGTGIEDQAQPLQKLITKNIVALRATAKLKESYSSRLIFIAAEMGNTTFLVELIRQYPDLVWKKNDNGLSLFHIAVKHRHEGIYNLLYEIGAMKDLITPLRDEHENNMLHFVGICAKQKQLEDMSGVALQMQRELLWFHDVKKMMPPSYRERKNRDGLTAQELFTLEHKDMVTQGEKWMKGTASQCIVVAALIATIVFAAAFTVPGGYDQNNGIPIFYSKVTFIVFVVADAISLFSSSTSILLFLSILTSRYDESDFLKSLPNKLVTGLLTLFLSITTMALSFCVSFFILYQRGLLWMPKLIAVLGLFPVFLYMCLQYGLFLNVIRSTYHSRDLFKSKHVLHYENPKV